MSKQLFFLDKSASVLQALVWWDTSTNSEQHSLFTLALMKRCKTKRVEQNRILLGFRFNEVFFAFLINSSIKTKDFFCSSSLLYNVDVVFNWMSHNMRSAIQMATYILFNQFCSVSDEFPLQECLWQWESRFQWLVRYLYDNVSFQILQSIIKSS